MFQKIYARLMVAGILIGAAFATTSSVASAHTPPVFRQDVQLDALLTAEAQKILDNLELMEGQRSGGTVTVSMDVEAGVITVGFELSFVPENYGAAFEDQLDEFDTTLSYLATTEAPVKEVRFLYNGKGIEEYFPELNEDGGDAQTDLGPSWRKAQAAFVSASHGIYYHHGYKDWRAQRPAPQGVQEDFITPAYADELQGLIEARSGMTVERPRSKRDGDHAESGSEWWKLAARYHIKALYPDKTSIWNSKGDRIYKLRDYDEDLNSRPYLANHLDASVALHIHTNGSNLPGVRGVEVLAQPGRAADSLLATSILDSIFKCNTH